MFSTLRGLSAVVVLWFTAAFLQEYVKKKIKNLLVCFLLIQQNKAKVAKAIF